MNIFKKMLKNKKLVIVVGALFFIVGVLYGAYVFSSKKLPFQFISERDKTAIISQNIVNLTDKTNKILSRVNNLDVQGKKMKALGLIKDAGKANSDAYKKAFELSGRLKDLAGSLKYIDDKNGQQVAYEAVATELALVSEFIEYTKSVDDFLNMLSIAISKNTLTNRVLVENILTKVNAGAKKINVLNAQFLDKMGKFDAIVR